MRLNLPILERLKRCKSVLIAGMGGGFDIFCGLPIYFELRRRDQEVHLANYSFSDVIYFEGGKRLTDTLVGLTAEVPGFALDFPELHLARWFQEACNEAVTIWSFHKTGTCTLLKNYRALTEHLAIDGILLIDGGVDSLMRGDEAATGTLIEDAISLFVVNELAEVKTRLLGTVGLGAEQDIAYAHVLENIARLTEAGGFLGACSLTPQMEAYQAYEEALLYVQTQECQEPSVINSSVVSAVQGHYGDYHLTSKTKGSSLWISPLLPIYWFFDLVTVAQHNLYLSQLRHTETFMDAVRAYTRCAPLLPRRPPMRIPLP